MPPWHGAQLAYELRQRGRRVELSTDSKLKRALEQANKTGAKAALLIGDDEIAAGAYSIKELATGQPKKITRDELLNV